MWCANCQADVATEVSTDNRRVRCTTCSVELTGLPRDKKSVSARQLLERWSSDTLLDPPGEPPSLPTPRKPTEEVPEVPSETVSDAPAAAEAPAAPAASSTPPRPKFRLDAAHPADSETTAAASERKPPVQPTPAPVRPPAAAEPQPTPPTLAAPTGRHVIAHQRHSQPIPPPHFDRESLFGDEKPKPNWAAAAGQFLAYAGVAVLTVGAALVIWGYFGGPEDYAPTGWLVSTIGQMLLFLGVITLVSGGMEQTTSEVSRRIETIGEHIIRIEEAAHRVPPPNIPPEAFVPGRQAPINYHDPGDSQSIPA